ncbi:FAD-dependent oxidoreductase [Weissella halotolerans]|uniref:NAD(FAD)-dependent dehydrogenase n=1 Tax=Weissella halotolerans DSM 20190 TaxID=1123500 RepID=A0A0R2FZM7_9LACO|nr:FAD-dependent oxidoreductase [Weissella halotolerans]KRN33406.1 NAD(FAD)-dependent dehydrogenase [Weissella halotolerans DSM 20190]
MKVAVIGSTHAGVFSAKQIKAQVPDAQIDVFERNQTVSFLSCGIALWVGNHVSDPARMFYESPESLIDQGINMHMGTEVVQADLAAKQLTIKDLVTDEERTDVYDKIVITTGSKAVIPPIPGIDGDKVYMAKNWDDANRLKEVADDVKRAVVIGAGYIGAELAEQMSLNGTQVTLVDALDRVLAKNASAEYSAVIEQAYQEHGVNLALGETVTEFVDNGEDITVKTTGGAYTADIAILGIGFRPATDLFTGQVDMLDNGAIITDKYMQTSAPDVFAAGDASAVYYNPTQSYDYIPLATNAVRQGILVGRNIVEPTVAYQGTQATSAVELYGIAFASTGLNADSAAAKGIKSQSITLDEDYRPDFLLTTESVKSSLTWDPETRRILGGEFMSTHDVTAAANVISLAIENQNTIDQLSMTDFFFQPNFDQPINYISSVAIAAASAAAE